MPSRNRIRPLCLAVCARVMCYIKPCNQLSWLGSVQYKKKTQVLKCMCCKICVSSSSSPCVYLWKPHHLVPEPRLSRLDLHRCWAASRGDENDILIADFTKEVLKEAFMQRCYQWVNLAVGRVWPRSDGITTSGTQQFIYVQTLRDIMRNNPTSWWMHISEWGAQY
jgi:hypothetical protein